MIECDNCVCLSEICVTIMYNVDNLQGEKDKLASCYDGKSRLTCVELSGQ